MRGAACLRLIFRSAAQRLDEQVRRCRARHLLLAGDELAVAHGEGAEQAVGDEVRSGDFFRFGFNPEGLNALAHCGIRVLFFGVGEARPGAARDEERTVGQFQVEQGAGGMADYRQGLARLPEVQTQLVDSGVTAEGVHRRLSAGKENGVEVGGVERVECRAVFEQCRVLGRGQEAQGDQVVGRVAAFVAGVGEAVNRDLAALGAGYGNVVTRLDEAEVGVRYLGDPGADRPAGLLRNGFVGRDEQDSLLPDVGVGVRAVAHDRERIRGFLVDAKFVGPKTCGQSLTRK